jgi:glyoxylase-like metal-dependent hydrolase (beta-lactamase superfamily II)
MNTSIATVRITGITPLSQSRQHDDPKLDGERPDDYDKRTWRSKLNVAERNGKPTVVIPAHGLHQAIASAAKYSKRQIPGQGKATGPPSSPPALPCLTTPAEHRPRDGRRRHYQRQRRRHPRLRQARAP